MGRRWIIHLELYRYDAYNLSSCCGHQSRLVATSEVWRVEGKTKEREAVELMKIFGCFQLKTLQTGVIFANCPRLFISGCRSGGRSKKNTRRLCFDFGYFIFVLFWTYYFRNFGKCFPLDLICNYCDLSSVFCVWTRGSIVFTRWKLMWILVDQTNNQHSICKSVKRDGRLHPIAANTQPSGPTTCLQVGVAQYSPVCQANTWQPLFSTSNPPAPHYLTRLRQAAWTLLARSSPANVLPGAPQSLHRWL